MKQWKTLSKQIILPYNDFLTVENHEIELPDGKIIDKWPWIITPDYVNIVAVTEDEKFIVFRQTKYAVEGVTLAVIGGYIEPGESALAAAQRELLEETGYEAKEWIELGKYPVDANRGAGNANFFLAKNAKRTHKINKDDLEEQEMLFLTLDEINHALIQDEFKCLSWTAAMLKAVHFLKFK
jgi:ADP-ribose pyrophosphatase